ncbi:potassium channel family protein [Natrialbaceae archaeon AArc-T1-2]|uniref:potassium channel family protein n=1 Tax=Natrialbaceae archaeon AArc-T1-2 TaxID=3053904 RepID=UPI00255A9B01|nr:NAD-binding protein [Natrialbaceae archaeon AArc-T1-2]WIV67861.1 NAD-binding protein [Natrialbaceae archaeon AArc-T1-2]
MALWRSRRTLNYLALVALTTAVFTVAYNLGMAIWEGRPQSLIRSLEVVFQSFTTTGYGQDAPWETFQMNVLVIAMQLAGIGLIVAAIQAFAVPLIRAAFEASPPTEAVAVENHVVVCGYTPRTEAFTTELASRDYEFVVVESDDETATELYESGIDVVHGDPESVDVLERAGTERATAVVADAADDENASIVLSAREVDGDVRIVTVVEDEELAAYHRIAGADEVLSPRQLLGQSLAERVPTAVTTAADERVELGEDLELVEVSITGRCELCGRSVAECRLQDRFGVTVVGAWLDGEFVSPVGPDLELDAGTRLLAAGDPDGVDDLRSTALSTVRELSPREVLIAGYGESGAAAVEAFADTSSAVTVLDVEDRPGVDVVGDARDPETLQEAGVEDADAVIVTVGDDTTAIFTTLIVRDLNPDVDVFVRAVQEEDVAKLYRAGADDVQSLATVSGRMLAATVFEDEAALGFDKQIRVVTTPAGELAGRTIVDADVRNETGATVLAIVRDDEVRTEFDPDTLELVVEDELVLAGTDESVSRFERQFV